MSLFNNFQMPSFKDKLYLSGLPFVFIFGFGGLNHFVDPPFYLGLMQDMPYPELHEAAVTVSGIMEGICGIGFLVQPSSMVVNWTIATLAAISPVHYYMYAKDTPMLDGKPLPTNFHVVRAAIQVAFFAWLTALRKAYIKRESGGDDSLGAKRE